MAYVPRAPVPYVTRVLRASRASCPNCSRASCSRVLVPSCLVPYVLSCPTYLVSYVPRTLRVLMLHVLLCPTCLVSYMLWCLPCLVPYVPFALRSSFQTCSRVTRVLGALVPHVSCALLVLGLARTLRALLRLVPHLLQVFQVNASHVF